MTSSSYQRALEAGYSEDQIHGYLSQKNPQYQKAVESGYSPQQISEHLSKKSIPSEIGRHAGRSGARVLETALGAPRAAGEFLESIVPEKAITKGAEKIGLGAPVKKGLEIAKKYAPYKLFPKSEDIRSNVTNFLFGKKLEPKNEWEGKADEAISDFTALALPLPGKELKLLKPAVLALGGNIASDIIGRMGGTKNQQTYSKLGTFLLGSLINPKGIDNLKKDLYDKARAARAPDATVSTKHLATSLDKLEQALVKGGIEASDEPALRKIADVRKEMQGALVPIESLERTKVKINEVRSGLRKALEGNKPGIRSANRNLDMVSRAVDNALDLYGTQNPEWAAYYRPANEVHGAVAQSMKVRNWLKKKKDSIGPLGAVTLFGVEQAVGLPKTAGALLAGRLALAPGEFLTKITKSPTLLKYYTNVATAALRDDVVAARENLKKLDNALNKESELPSEDENN